MAEAKRPALQKGNMKGTLGRWAYLVTPDYGSDAFPKPEGEWKAELSVPAEDAQAFIEKIDTLTADTMAATRADLEQKLKEAKTGEDKAKLKKAISKLTTHLPYSEGLDSEGDPNGTFVFKMSSAASYKDKKASEAAGKAVMKKRPLPLFNCARPPQPITPDAIWAGSVLVNAFEYFPYHVPATGQVGVKLRLNAVQVVKLVQGGAGSGDAASYGFGSDDDGYQDADNEHGFSGSEAGADDAQDEAPSDAETEDSVSPNF